MKRTTPKFFYMAVFLVVAAVWGGFVIHAENSRAVVNVVERHPAEDITNAVNPQDCYVKAVYPDGSWLTGYMETAACTYLKPGDKVVERDGKIQKG